MRKLLKNILKFRDQRDWKQFHLPKNLAISLSLEASEVLELFQWSKTNDLPKGKERELEEELADVYYWLILLAHQYNVDLDKALDNKMKKNAKHYPINKAKGKADKYTKL